MTVYSMTGYASTVLEVPCEGAKTGVPLAMVVDLRSVNGRFLDITLKVPDEYRALEPRLRELISGALRRGKVELRLHPREVHDAPERAPTPPQLERLASLQAAVLDRLPDARKLSVNEVLAWCRSGATADNVPHEQALEAVGRCVKLLRESREREGTKISEAMRDRLSQLRDLAGRAEPLVPAAVQRQRERFIERWRESVESASTSMPMAGQTLQERALQEATAYAMRIDVAEELARLVAHLDEIERLLAEGGELGKRLDFIIQELHREANTLGSKSAALELTTISVDMRVLIEQLREMVQNIE